jgi:cell division protein FtsZ
MGAVIDEGMQNRVEVCVLGTSDMGGRSVQPRRLVPTRSKAPVTRPEDAAPAPTLVAAVTPEPMHTAAQRATAAKIAQEEFGFGEVESRGHFEKTDRNLFDGQDLDVPTYLRKGIKIAL